MDRDVEEALNRAKQRLAETKDKIVERHEEGVENSTDEPKALKSGYRDDLRFRRIKKEDTNEKLP